MSLKSRKHLTWMTEEDIAEIRISLFHFWLLVDGFLLLEHFWLSADFWKMVLQHFVWFSALGRLLVFGFCFSELKILEKL